MTVELGDEQLIVISQMLEEAAFVFIEPIPTAPLETAEIVFAKLTFAGPESGFITMGVSEEFATTLAASLLGVDPDDPDVSEKQKGAVGEILNIIVGALMETMFGDKAVINLGIPEVAIVDTQTLRQITEQAQHRATFLTDDDYRLDFSVHLS